MESDKEDQSIVTTKSQNNSNSDFGSRSSGNSDTNSPPRHSCGAERDALRLPTSARSQPQQTLDILNGYCNDGSTFDDASTLDAMLKSRILEFIKSVKDTLAYQRDLSKWLPTSIRADRTAIKDLFTGMFLRKSELLRLNGDLSAEGVLIFIEREIFKHEWSAEFPESAEARTEVWTRGLKDVEPLRKFLERLRGLNMENVPVLVASAKEILDDKRKTIHQQQKRFISSLGTSAFIVDEDYLNTDQVRIFFALSKFLRINCVIGHFPTVRGREWFKDSHKLMFKLDRELHRGEPFETLDSEMKALEDAPGISKKPTLPEMLFGYIHCHFKIKSEVLEASLKNALTYHLTDLDILLKVQHDKTPEYVALPKLLNSMEAERSQIETSILYMKGNLSVHGMLDRAIDRYIWDTGLGLSFGTKNDSETNWRKCINHSSEVQELLNEAGLNRKELPALLDEVYRRSRKAVVVEQNWKTARLLVSKEVIGSDERVAVFFKAVADEIDILCDFE